MSGILGRRRFQDITLNISGIVLPMGAGFLVVPDLIGRLGAERFGILSICWMLVGYFGILDLGLGRGLTQYLARQVGLGMHDGDRANVARRVRRWMLVIGTVWMFLLLLATPLLTTSQVYSASKIQSEVISAWLLLALSVPLLLWATCSIGALEAYSRFKAVNAVRVPMGFSVFIVPWLISHFTPNLAAVIGGLWIVRLFSALALAWVSRDCFQVEGGSVLLPRARDILRFGGWLTVTNIIGPMLTYFDRFAISALLSLTAVTYYTVSFDVLSRLPAIPVAMMGVFFPAFAQIHAKTDGGDTDLLRTTQVSIRILCVLWVPMMLTIGLFGEKLLTLWLGVDMAVASAQVWHWLAIGVLVNGFAHVPYALLQSAGRTDITAKFHLLELVPYFIFLWWALEIYGITGAAIAWTVRICIDTVALFWAAGRVSPVVFYLSRNTLVLLTLLIIVYFCIGEYIAQSIQDPVVTGAVCILLLFMTAWIIYQMRQLRLDARESR